MTVKIIDGKKIASHIKNEINKEVNNLESKYGIFPNITTIKIGSNPESDLYLRLRDKACSAVGINSNHKEYSNKVTQENILKEISKLNKDSNVNGILIQLPLPSHISQDVLINALDPKKDVEGMHPINLGNTLLGNELIVPCTPLAVLTILESEKTKLEGKDIAIINHSNIVGKPLTALFLNRNATVSVCHVFTKDMAKFTKNADILVTAAGVSKLIKSKHVKKGAFVIDVGIVSTKNGITGDVDFEQVKKIAGKITPVPGGVGPVTIASSLKNMIKTTKNCI